MTELLKVLIVDDSEYDTLRIERTLQEAGYTVAGHRVNTGSAMEKALALEGWDIVVSDYDLGSFSGLDALRILQKSGRDIPFILVSSPVGETIAAGLMRAGAHDYVLKDNLDTLPAAVVRERREVLTRHERRRTAEELAASVERERRLLMAVDQAVESIVITDSEGTIEYVNPAFERVTGYTREEVVGQNPRLLKSGVQSQAFYRELWETLKRGEPWSGKFVNRGKDGALFTEEAVISPVRDANGEIINYVAVKRDITKELQKEEQLQQAQKIESLGLVASGVAHDINTPITGITGYAELLKQQINGTNPAAAEYADEIIREASRIHTIVHSLLGFAGRDKHTYSRTQVREVVDSILTLIRTILNGDGIRLVVDVPENLPEIRTTGQKIQQAIMNLLTNARDALNEKYPGGHPEKEIRIVAQALDNNGDGRWVRTTVEDTGPGIPDEIGHRLYEPFYTTKSNNGGTGLGLAISRSIVEEHGGKLTAESRPGQGTRFHIDLPVCSESPAAGRA